MERQKWFEVDSII